ncbi:peptidase S66, LD-carboxypeptidase A [Myriangium duriaei CBS 260.36]|uniref:Peptidase S66, LD-carboxypeptidase A n=1 Tax=Myriangium duriaei CBS 260.36 TaxID=1168546 RepID=A0A9P4ITS7_9PEZI|nr:peptidase S66, LD-carboxypeptidase A [Myriangium duriaei CBS 260.36]
MSNAQIPRLERGDLIAFVSPSARLNNLFSHRIERGVAFFEKAGYRVRVIFDQLSDDYATGIQQRCDELHQAFRDPEIKAIICTIGGNSCNELLEHLDYDLIRHNPKIFCGFSDITLLHAAFWSQAGLHTFYGPAVITNFADYPTPLSFISENFFSTVCGRGISGPAPVPRSPGWSQEWLDWLDPVTDRTPRTLQPTASKTRWLRPGQATGRLLGGCLPSVMQTLATKYSPNYTGAVLLLETPEAEHRPDAPWGVEQARSALTDLRNAGVLGKITGLVLGRPFLYDQEMTERFEQVVLEQCRGTDFPVLANVDVGHTHPIATLALGCLVRLDSEADAFELLESAVG